ncbi:MAG: hypothetical protein ACQETP_11680, partial [Bacteroidota bacterium]
MPILATPSRFWHLLAACIGVLLFSVVTLPVQHVHAQTGPGGIGNASGNNGQPANLLWLRANSLTLNNGDPVSAWNDQSGNGL